MSFLGKFGLQLNKRSLIGLLIHIPVGLVNGYMFAFPYMHGLEYTAPCFIVLGVVFGYTFLRYEETQGSKPHLDIKGYCWGLVIFFGGLIIYFLV